MVESYLITKSSIDISFMLIVVLNALHYSMFPHLEGEQNIKHVFAREMRSILSSLSYCKHTYAREDEGILFLYEI